MTAQAGNLAAALVVVSAALGSTGVRADLDPAVARLVSELRERVAAQPGSAAAHEELALAYEANGLWVAARDAWKEALRLEPGSPDRLLHLAITQRQGGDFAESLATLERLAAAFPEHAPSVHRLGLAQLDAGDTAGARATFERLLRLAPGRPEAPTGLADALLREGEVATALRLLEGALRADPNYRAAHYLLGQAYRAAGRQEEARRHLALGREAPPRYLPDALSDRVENYAVNLTARLDQARAHLAQRRPDRAVELLEAVRADHPENVTVLNNLAIAHMHGGDLATARRLLEQALEIDDAKFSTYINLAAWSRRSNRPDEALRWSDQALARAPGVGRVHSHRGGLLIWLGRTDEAIGSFRTALETGAEDPQVYLALADLALRRGQAEASATYSDRAIELWPDLLPAYVLLFRARLEAADLDRARAALELVRRLAPDYPGLGELERLLAQAEGGAG